MFGIAEHRQKVLSELNHRVFIAQLRAKPNKGRRILLCRYTDSHKYSLPARFRNEVRFVSIHYSEAPSGLCGKNSPVSVLFPDCPPGLPNELGDRLNVETPAT